MYKTIVKPFIDFIGSFILICLLLPILIFIYLLLFILYHKNPLYFQVRTGLNMKPFGFVKFRCLSDQMEMSESERLTPFGRFLRKTSLDELPQLFLILTGTMSFVGPRPLPLEYDTHYTDEQMIRFTVRPGLTGLVQISGRNALNWTERFELDIQYVKSLSLKNDIYIIRATFLQMFKKVPDENLFSAKWYGNR